MKQKTHYLNTDLDLVAGQSLQALADALETRGVFPLHVALRDDQQWYSILETAEQFTQPEPNIVALLTAIEALDPQSRILWDACGIREFNLGYDCGDEPRAFNHGLTVSTLARMAALGISLRITLYPAENEASPTSEPTDDA